MHHLKPDFVNAKFMQRGHLLAHSFYLTAATLEGHLFYSTMAAATLLFMLGSSMIGEGH